MAETREKVVVHHADGIIKGYLHSDHFQSPEQVLVRPSESLPDALSLLDASGIRRSIDLQQAKAVFFVREFEGDTERKDLHFHQHSPTNNAVWVRLEFQDGEELEGLVHNSISHVNQSGFFLLPTDPGSNNRLVYVLKSALASFCVLGVRNL